MNLLQVTAAAFLCSLCAFAFGDQAYAGDEPPENGEAGVKEEEGRNRRGMERLIRELGLKEEEAGKLEQAMSQAQEAVRAAMKARDEKLRGFLSEEQIRRIQEMNRRTQGGRREGGRGGGRMRKEPGAARWILFARFSGGSTSPRSRKKKCGK